MTVCNIPQMILIFFFHVGGEYLKLENWKTLPFKNMNTIVDLQQRKLKQASKKNIPHNEREISQFHNGFLLEYC